ncbi:hypothetical protein FRB96_008349 [Tulasnella sp. 330]|nr:hypothetical protein FRB96_008349 [Tulasnella sp. 330]
MEDFKQTIQHDEHSSEAITSELGVTGHRDSREERFSFKSLFRKVDNQAFFTEALEKYGKDGSIDPVAEKRLVRKLDYLILPCVDKTTLSYAAIFGIKSKATGLDLVGTQYSWLSSIFYFGWLIWAIPSNLLLQRFPPGTYLAFNIFMWGALLMCQAASTKFAHLAALRLLSGAFEAIADPAFMLFTSMFYTRAEQPNRISFWYSANGVGTAVGGLLGYAIGHIHGDLASWRYEFIIIGCICATWALVLLVILPNSPATSVFLTRDERLMAVARLRKNQTGIENRKFKMSQLIEAALDVKTWLFLLLGFVGNIPNGGISNFSTLIIKGLGFDTLNTALLAIPQGALVIFWIGTGALLNHRLPKNSRTLVCMIFMIPTIAGTLGFLLAPEHANIGRLICFYMTGSYQTTFVLSLSLITSNTGGQTKKMILAATIWLGACIGNIAGPFFYKTSQAPTYRLGIGSMLVANCLEVLIILILRIIFIRANKAKERRAAELQAEAEAGHSKPLPEENDTAFSDMTDKENINFRYVY